eukprot:TRINITY_DN48272_c0_g1_i1.p1 TRINITY_DN48272_c0_g1~~TRINITY_DN48272_c0_g1_i1.p1  ORF type:complete len:276 (-),score=36.13 TRINITY_DN48272_c0_g1_i1:92-919(-)
MTAATSVVEKDTKERLVRILSAWFCPYCSQVRIAFAHRAIAHELVEALRYPNDDPANANQPYEKSEELLRLNPAGLVPTIVCPEGRRVVTEMIPAIELADDLPGGGPRLLPSDPWERGRVRTAAEWLQRKVCGGFTEVLMPGDAERRDRAFKQLIAALQRFSVDCRGPLFSGETLGLVDVVLAPFASLLFILEHYLGDAFRVPQNDPKLKGFWEWYDAVMAIPSVSATMLSRERAIAVYQRYAEGTAKTKVAEAVKSGGSSYDAAAGSLDVPSSL